MNGSPDWFWHHMMAMRDITRNELVNGYWDRVHQVAENGFMAFILRGNLIWQTDDFKQVWSPTESAWLKSDWYDPIGKHYNERPIKVYSQWYLNQYDIWGGLRVDVRIDDAASTKLALEKGIRDINLLSDLTSVFFGASLSWLPATYRQVTVTRASSPPDEPEHVEWQCIPFPSSQEKQTGSGVGDENIIAVLRMFDRLKDFGDEELLNIMRRAISWHASGNLLSGGLNRFLNYWQSVELLAYFFYERLNLDDSSSHTRSEKKETIFSILTSNRITRRNCLRIADQCRQVLASFGNQIGIEKKIEALLKELVRVEVLSEDLGTAYCQSIETLYRIRNDIVHANQGDHDLEFTEEVESRLREIQRLSRDVLVGAVRKLPELAARISV